MTIHLSKELEQFVHDAIRAGRYATEDELFSDALERLRRQTPLPAPGMGSIGAMRDDADLLDQAVEHAMRVREERPWRTADGE
jgi:Arc/MetJ-type ribon-helix-helix transcriptional regulator